MYSNHHLICCQRYVDLLEHLLTLAPSLGCDEHNSFLILQSLLLVSLYYFWLLL